LDVYVQYRIAGGLMKFNESDTGNEYHYAQFPGIVLLPYGVWSEDYNNIPPSEQTMCYEQYREWFYSVHPAAVDVRQAMRFRIDRRAMLWRRQHPTPGSYEEFLQAKRWIGTGPKYEDGYDYIVHQEDTEDGGSLYRMHMTRQQAALDLQTSVGELGYITEMDIDRYLIANHEPMPGEEEHTNVAREKARATMDMIRESYAKHYAREGFIHVPPPPRTREVPLPEPQQHDWDFFYRSLQASQTTRPRILAKLCSGTTPEFKSELRTQRATTLSERIGKRQHAMQAAIRKQRNVNAIIDTGAQECGKLNACRAQPPRCATRHSSQVRQRRD